MRAATTIVLARSSRAAADVFDMPPGLAGLESIAAGSPGDLADTEVMRADGTTGRGLVACVPEPATPALLGHRGLVLLPRRRGGGIDTRHVRIRCGERPVDSPSQPRSLSCPMHDRQASRPCLRILLSAVLALGALMAAPSRSQALHMTLSDAGLLDLDYDYYHFFIPHHTAQILERRDVPGPGVEFDIRFLNNYSPHNSMYWISDNGYGAGRITGIDVSAYSHFDLKFTILAADGVSAPGTGGSLVAGALIGLTASGTQYSYQPRGLSLGLSYPVTALSSTTIGSPTITRIGFVVRLEPDWTAEPHTVTLLIEPAPGAIQIPEPSVLSLLSLAALAPLLRRRR